MFDSFTLKSYAGYLHKINMMSETRDVTRCCQLNVLNKTCTKEIDVNISKIIVK